MIRFWAPNWVCKWAKFCDCHFSVGGIAAEHDQAQWGGSNLPQNVMAGAQHPKFVILVSTTVARATKLSAVTSR